MKEKCEVCKENIFKYKCPRCVMKTCSLQCVKAHKAQTNCSGQRHKTGYVAMKSFTDINLLNDYRFLEDAGRKTNSTTRDPLRKKHFKPNFLKELEKQAGRRQIKLRIMPYPMTRRKNNFTTYNYKSKSILWHIEWKFPQSGLSLVDKRIDETTTLESCLERHIGVDADPIIKHKLKPYIEATKDKWALFMKRENSAGKRFYRLNMTDTMTNNLLGKMLIEYPIIHVVLEPHWSEYNTEGDDTINVDTTQDDPAKVNNTQVDITQVKIKQDDITQDDITQGDETQNDKTQVQPIELTNRDMCNCYVTC